MSLDLEQRLKVFFASAPQAVRAIQTIEVSHSAMTQTFALWREPYAGMAGGLAMQPCNFQVKLAGNQGHLDQVFNIQIDTTDIEDTFRRQLDLIPVETAERVRIIYREFLSDDLENPQATAILQAESINYNKGGASISAVSPRLNMTRTGERYTPKDVPMLRGFL
jgi:hypothetical protein